MAILVIVQHDNTTLHRSTLPVITAALQLAPAVELIVIGYRCAAVALAAAKISGVRVVHCMDNAVYEHQLAENTAKVLASHAASYSHILAPATTFGKNLLPRVAALLDVAQWSDVVEIIDATTIKRFLYAGNVLATVSSVDPIKVMTIRATAFAPALVAETSAAIVAHDTVITAERTRFVSRHASVTERPELTAARVIISGGRGLQSAANFELLERIARRLNAAIGASRAAVDAGYVANDCQVGQTGKIVAPELYIAVGISGALQHVAGIKDSKVIVAINRDPDAAIFQIADYGLVGDLFVLLPQLDEALAAVLLN